MTHVLVSRLSGDRFLFAFSDREVVTSYLVGRALLDSQRRYGVACVLLHGAECLE